MNVNKTSVSKHVLIRKEVILATATEKVALNSPMI